MVRRLLIAALYAAIMGPIFGDIAALLLSYPQAADAWSFAKTSTIVFLVVWGAFAFVFRPNARSSAG